MAPKNVKLVYFDGRGRAEPIRLTFVAGGVEFEDERIKGEEFMKRKKGGELTFGSLPVLVVDDEMYGESGALLRYAATLGGLTPKSPEDQLKVDMLIDVIESVTVNVYKDSSIEARTKFVENDIPRYFAPVNAVMSKSDGPFLLGDKISAGDIKLACMVAFFKESILDHVPVDCVDKYPAVIAAHDAVFANENIKKWYAKRASA